MMNELIDKSWGDSDLEVKLTECFHFNKWENNLNDTNVLQALINFTFRQMDVLSQIKSSQAKSVIEIVKSDDEEEDPEPENWLIKF